MTDAPKSYSAAVRLKRFIIGRIPALRHFSHSGAPSPIETEDARARVQAARDQSKTLPVLRERLRAHFKGTRCCVIGAAPELVAPPIRPGDRYICANGSARSAAELGVDPVDLTAITGYATHMITPLSKSNRTAWRGRRTRELVFIDNGDSEAHARRIFDEVDFRYDRFTGLTIYERAAIIEDVAGHELAVGPRDDRVSMGVVAAILALWGEAKELVLCGFSLQGGHRNFSATSERQHAMGDARFFERLPRLSVRACTTVKELQDQFGIPAAR